MTMSLAPRPPRRLSKRQPAAAGQSAPGRVLLAFAAVLLLLFAASFTVGRLVGPLSPRDFPGSGGHGGGSVPGMTMPGMGAVAPRPLNSAAGSGR
ncbi:hypothetical protein GXW82_11255 [Streptacidiphilus sp. 4-A2]|nr:hypothetical protein [Streptacidiphilus sp. 4-A2]